jgi:hypothetical protein
MAVQMTSISVLPLVFTWFDCRYGIRNSKKFMGSLMTLV